MNQLAIYRTKEQQEQLIADFENHIGRKVDNKTKTVLRTIMPEENQAFAKGFQKAGKILEGMKNDKN